MFSREFKESDYPEYASWLSSRGRMASAFEDLPKIGLMIFDESEDIIAGFMYETNSKSSAFGNIASNPDVTGDRRSEAIKFLVESFMKMSKDMGYKSAFVTTNLPRFVERLKTMGFKEQESHLTQLGVAL